VIPDPPLDAPDEDWLVWADAMQQIGDPRGELLALGHRESFVRDHAEALLGRALGRHVRKGEVRVTRWRRCHVDELELRISHVDEGPSLVQAAFTAPCAARLRSLVVAGVPIDTHSEVPPQLDLARTIEWLCRRDLVPLPPALCALALVDDRARSVDHLISRDFQPDRNLVAFGPLVALYQALAHLEELAIVVADPDQLQLGPIRLPDLRSFALRGLRWPRTIGSVLATAYWPKLRSLELRLCDTLVDEDPDDAHAYASVWVRERTRPAPAGTLVETLDDLESVFAGIRRLPLERLALTSFQDADAVVDALLAAELPPTLREIDLSDSALDASHVELLAGLPVPITHSWRPGQGPPAARYRYIVTRE
jgi:hypothetical protein